MGKVLSSLEGGPLLLEGARGPLLLEGARGPLLFGGGPGSFTLWRGSFTL